MSSSGNESDYSQSAVPLDAPYVPSQYQIMLQQTSRSPGLFGSESSFECDSPGSLAKKAKREVHPLLDLPDLVLTLLLVLAAEVVAGAETAVVGLPRP